MLLLFSSKRAAPRNLFIVNVYALCVCFSLGCLWGMPNENATWERVRWPLPCTLYTPLPLPTLCVVLCAMYKQAIEFLVHFAERTSTCEDILYGAIDPCDPGQPVNPRGASVKETSVEIRRKGQFYR